MNSNNVYYTKIVTDKNVINVKKNIKFSNPDQMEASVSDHILSLQKELSVKWNRYVSMSETLAVYLANQQFENVHKSEQH
jgi:hypothetical protein